MAAPRQGETRLQEAAVVARGSSDANALNRRSRLPLDTAVAQNGCFEVDRVIKSGFVQKRGQKTKNWKSVYLVLRPNGISIYKDDKEAKLRHHLYTSELSAVAFLKDPKHKRKNLFGLFSPSRNFHFQASTAQDAQEWVEAIRKVARLDEEEEEMYLGSPVVRNVVSPGAPDSYRQPVYGAFSSSPENMAAFESTVPKFMPGSHRLSYTLESSGLSGNEMLSYSDFSDNDAPRRQGGTSYESLAAQSPPELHTPGTSMPRQPLNNPLGQRPETGVRSASQVSAVTAEQESERVVWQGALWMHRSKGGVRQWKHMWGVLRARQLVLYKDESEYAAQSIIEVADVVNVVEMDPVSRSKTNCLQIITEEKTYRFCAPDEESLVQFLGAFKSLLARRRAAAAAAIAVKSPPR
ncbi:PH-domain-containing protein [Trichoderma citrinoviride]|uniref:PH-domain-containing protein n=1 Tax=Trichoderma citrinoviride TaxID=58853 RepID=A0A2T4AYV0_9HYPO|nr:PH-domain-containing protein [Trichoderma citrinoviride]PTB62246.1 PH-domain-containing protein [Trichoderma citrinoviride]